MRIVSILSVALCSCLVAYAAGPGGGGPGGGGGWQPGGGGGNQPDMPGGGGSGNSFVYDTFLTDKTTEGGCVVYGTLLVGFVEDEAEIVVPASVTSIAPGAFAGNESVTSLDLRAATGLADVPDAFAAGCPSLAAVSLPASVTEVGAASFTMNAQLASFDGAGVTTVGAYAFYGCPSLVLTRTALDGFAETGTDALAGVSYLESDGSLCRTEARPLVAWLKSGGAEALASAPASYATADLKSWLAADVARLDAFLFAESRATNAAFAALSVSGTSFRVATPDASAADVIYTTLQVSTDLSDGDWKTVPSKLLVDGLYALPEEPIAFARLVYTIPW